MKQLERIEKFLVSLEERGVLQSNQLSYVVSTDLDKLGGEDYQNKGCINESTIGCGSNYKCTNLDLSCGLSSNTDCSNSNKSEKLCNPKPQNASGQICTSVNKGIVGSC